MSNNIVWFRDKLQRASEANLNVLSPTVQYGLNVFEGVRCYLSYNSMTVNAFRLHDHVDRLYNSCKILKLGFSYTKEQLCNAIFQTMEANNFQNDASIRVVILVDDIGNWAYKKDCEFLVSPVEMKSTLGCDKGLSACVSSWQRISDRSMPPRIKCGANYMNSRMSQVEALENGYDTALLLNHHGYVSEAPGSCVFMVRNNCLITPAVTDSILESITRDTVIQLAKQLKIDVVERSVDRTELYVSDEVFLCGTAMEIKSVFSIDHVKIGEGSVGPITQALKDAYLRTVRGEVISPDYNWLFPVITLASAGG